VRSTESAQRRHEPSAGSLSACCCRTKRQSVAVSPRLRGRRECVQSTDDANQRHVTFSDKVVVHFQSGWSDQDYRNARKSKWMQYAADRARFRRYVHKFDCRFGYMFSDTHRSNIRRVIDEQLNVDDVVVDVAALAL